MIDTTKIKQLIRNIPDFPKPGIHFKDITTLLKEKKLFSEVVDILCERYFVKENRVDKVIGIEARGFILAGAIAYKLKAGMVPVRKENKLPAEKSKITYDLEYGTDTLEIHKDAISDGDRILIVDDLLATGGTVKAVIELLNNWSIDIVAIDFLIELSFLKGREKLGNLPVFSLVKYD